MTTKTSPRYDYGIVGSGIAGIQLAIALIKDPHFSEKTILIIEQDSKDTNDKTLCFWEEGSGQWDHLIAKTWSKGKFINSDGQLNSLNLGEYKYKMLPSLAFYNSAKKILLEDKRVNWVKAKVTAVEQQPDGVTLVAKGKSYDVNHCFDSRITVNYQNIKSEAATIFQPFIGLEVEFESAIIDTDAFTMMDYQFRREDNTGFFYVLPLSEKKVFVEYTLFVPQLPDDMKEYLPHIESYIRAKISDQEYAITHTEQGMIPMTSYAFHNANTDKITKIGTAGSWVRPSTGYAFKYIEYYVSKVINNLKAGKQPSHKLFNKRHQMMDTLLIDLLQEENQLGPSLFDTMYRKISVPLIFKFLDGKTTLLEDLKIMNSFNYRPFFRAIRRQWF